MIKAKLQKEFQKFIKIAEGIHSYNLREHSLRKLKYDFQKYEKMEETELNENFFEKLDQEYEKLKRIKLLQNMYVLYEEFPFKGNDFKEQEKI